MRKIYLVPAFLCACLSSKAQVSVTATGGIPGPTTYTSLKLAFDALNIGTHTGVVNISITGNTTEPGSAVLASSGTGAASYTAVNIRPATGVAANITGDVAAPLIDLDGADNINIDGQNSDGTSLTITNVNGGASGVATVRLFNDAMNNTIQRTTLQGSGGGAASGTIMFGTGMVTGNDNNTISNCIITDAPGGLPVNGIVSTGTAVATQENSNNTISGNQVSNYFSPALSSTGITVGAGNTDWTIINNKFFQTAARAVTTANLFHRVVFVSSGSNHTINGNTIGFAGNTATGAYTITGAFSTRFVGIELAHAATGNATVQNNTIAGIVFGTSSNVGSATVPAGIWCAINITSGITNAGTVNITGNTIGSTSSTGSVVVTPSGSGPWMVAITCASTGTVNIAGNVFGGIELTPTAALSGTFMAIQTQGAAGNVTVTNNIIGNTLPLSIKVGTLGTTTGSGIIRAIFNTNAGTVNITRNTIRNLAHLSSSSLGLFRAVECQQGTANVSANNISNISTAGTATSVSTPGGAGILFTSALTGCVIDSNTIYNLGATATTAVSGPAICGIWTGSSNGLTISRNRIYGLTNAGTSTSATLPPIAVGIVAPSANVANPLTIVNNMIALGSGQTTNTVFTGIWHSANNAYSARIYNNSVTIEGIASSGAQPSFCYHRGDFSASFVNPSVDVKNNIFTNKRTGGGKHFAIANSYGSLSSSTTGWASDYNVLNGGAAATTGYWSGDQNFTDWKISSGSGDNNSLSGVTIIYADSSQNLHLTNIADTVVDGKGTPLATVLVDYDLDPRHATTPDMGADEFIRSSLPVKMEYFTGKKQGSNNLLGWKAMTTTASVLFTIERSGDGRRFTTLESMNATRLRCEQPFAFIDASPLPGTNYYRLKMTEADGQVYYSYIIAIVNKSSGFELVGITPTVVSRSAVVSISSAEAMLLELALTNTSGQLVQKQQVQLVAGSNIVTLNTTRLPVGAYQLVGYAGGIQTGAVRFVKQ